MATEIGIQRCKAIILHYQSLEKKAIPFQETLAQVDETLRLFPRTKEDDALYPVEELIDMYQDFDYNFPDCFLYKDSSHERVEGPSLALGPLLGYFERNGPGTPYLKAFSLFATIASGSTVVDDIAKTLLSSFDIILNRVDREATQQPADCVSMLKSLNDVSKLFNEEKSPLFKTPPNVRREHFEKAISLCKKYPTADSRVLAGLYSLANTLAGTSFQDVTRHASKLREDLIKAFLEIKHPDHSRLDVLSAWFVQSLDLSLFAFRLFPLGLQLVRQMPDRVDTFLGSVHIWLLSESLYFLLMMHMPEAMVMIEETASRESIPAVQCLLICLVGDVRDLRTQKQVFHLKGCLLDAGIQITEESDFTLVDHWQRRLLLKAVELFSVPSKLSEAEAARNQAESIYNIMADPKRDALHPLLELWSTHLVDDRYSWTHRRNVFTLMYQGTPLSLSTSNRIWMHDKSRYVATSSEDLAIATWLLRSVRWRVSPQDPLGKYDVDLVLLLTWFRAPAMLPRLKTKSTLALLNTDILRRLARMMRDPNTKEKIFPTPRKVN